MGTHRSLAERFPDCGSDCLFKRASPKIGGSVGGFVALIVGLVLIILICGIAVVFLLKEQASYNAERASRRQRNMYPHIRSATQSPADYTYRTSTGTPQQKPWSAKLRGFLGLRVSENNPRLDSVRVKGGKGGVGWMQTGSGDDWDIDARSQTGTPAQYRPPARQMSGNGLAPTYIAAPTPNRPVPASYPSADSTTSVRFDLNAVRGLSYYDRYAPSPQSTLPSIHMQLSSPASSNTTPLTPVRTISPEPISSSANVSEDSEGRHFSTHSGHSMRTFEGGTKFIEAL